MGYFNQYLKKTDITVITLSRSLLLFDIYISLFAKYSYLPKYSKSIKYIFSIYRLPYDVSLNVVMLLLLCVGVSNCS